MSDMSDSDSKTKFKRTNNLSKVLDAIFETQTESYFLDSDSEDDHDYYGAQSCQSPDHCLSVSMKINQFNINRSI